jgi:UDP-N-acetylglucosamine--N-acetylmuramyl-(pentapeptide) pyrophosphoryl-undecaprenol N-acetylglucosamine transferase
MKSNKLPAFVASTGGHLEQLFTLAPRLHENWQNGIWITFDSPQSRSTLKDHDVRFVDYIPPRGAAKALRSCSTFRRFFSESGVSQVFSTGSAIAVPALFVARSMGIHSTYIESLARADGPSLSGRILAFDRGIHLSTQYGAWANERWKLRQSVLDNWAPTSPARRESEHLRIFVTLGTIRPYRFIRILNQVQELLAPGDEVRPVTSMAKSMLSNP